MPASLFLRIDQPPVHRDLEHASRRRDDLQRGDLVLEVPKDLGRQTDGPVEVASDRAVLDPDLQRPSRPVARPPILIGVMTSRVRPRSRAGPAAPAPRGPRDGGDGDDGGGSRWAWLVTAGGTIEAELIRGRLESAGVPVVLDRRDPSPGAWLYLSGNVNAPIQVLVPRGLLDAARLELLEAGFEAPPAEPDRPSSPEPRPRGRWIMVIILCALVVALILVLQMLGSATCAIGVVC